MSAGMLLFSNSGNIAKLAGDPVADSGEGSKTGLVIAILSFWIIDAFTNSLQVRASSLQRVLSIHTMAISKYPPSLLSLLCAVLTGESWLHDGREI